MPPVILTQGTKRTSRFRLTEALWPRREAKRVVFVYRQMPIDEKRTFLLCALGASLLNPVWLIQANEKGPYQGPFSGLWEKRLYNKG
jgi:hypothetical protein